MTEGGLEVMLARAADLAARHAPPPSRTGSRVRIAPNGALALADGKALATLRASGAAGDHPLLRWLSCRLLGRPAAIVTPLDAVAVRNPDKPTLILLSVGGGYVLKLSRGADAAAMLTAEIAAVSSPAVVAQGLAPRVLASGAGADEAWLVSEFSRTARFGTPAVAVAALRADLLPRVFTAWEAAGLERDTAGALAARVAAAGETLPASAVQRLVELHAACGDFAFPRVATHGDLQPRHLMTGVDGRLLLIDWDTAARRAWTADLLRLDEPGVLFGAAWEGGEALLAPAFRPVFEDGLAWSAGRGFADPGPAGRAFLVLGALIERILEIAATRGLAYGAQPRSIRSLAAMGLDG
jgi:hypothetical protein